MTLFQKLGESISANIHNAIEKRENPSIMADYYLRKSEEELDETRKNTAEVIADRKAIERELESTKKNIEEMQAYAEKAMEKGNKEDARKFLEKKANFSKTSELLEKNFAIAKSNEEKMVELFEKQSQDFENLKSQKASISANVSIASTQQKINAYSTDSHSNAKARFRRMEEKATRMVDVSSSEAEITANSNSVEVLKDKYSTKDTDIEKELEELEKKYS